MKILVKRISLLNFKGIRQFSATLDTDITNIFGKNEAGKSTLFDAFLWGLFGKDSFDRKDFPIKTLDNNNEPYHKLEHEVTILLLVDGEEIEIKRIYREKWQTKRGETTEEFKGHENSFFWNSVPCNEAEFKKQVAQLIDEGIFKMITNTTYFNSMKWQDMRSVLLVLAGDISDADIIAKISTTQMPGYFSDLEKALAQKKTPEKYRLEIGAKKKTIKDALSLLPSRIEEAKRALPEVRNYEKIQSEIDYVTLDIQGIDGQLMNTSTATKEHQVRINELLNRRQEFNSKLMTIDFGIKNDIQQKKQAWEKVLIEQKNILRTKQDDISRTLNEYTTESNRKAVLVDEQSKLREDWTKVDAEKLEFNEGEFHCPACKREFEASDVDAKKIELTQNFNKNKSDRLNKINERGVALGTDIAALETKIGNLKAKGETLRAEETLLKNHIAELETEHSRLTENEATEIEQAITASKERNQILKEIEELNTQIDTPFQAEDNSALLQRKSELTQQLDQLKVQLSTKDQREKQLQRIEELQNEESNSAQELADLERIEFSIMQFEKAKMNEVEDRVNNRFKLVKFKLFETQINGGEIPCCETLMNGVPYHSVNTAGRIQAGIDIINTLSEHYNVFAPIFIDNRESVTSIPETNSQIINLIVSPADKVLRVEQGALEEAMA
ncbi:MAG: AAA family ATPase [Chitinophagales bacterium]|nr:AAA family ATPase [Chitinophagales bacterium]MBP9845815.1 AAA family ATPase [Saprospiraceae bacterium]